MLYKLPLLFLPCEKNQLAGINFAHRCLRYCRDCNRELVRARRTCAPHTCSGCVFHLCDRRQQRQNSCGAGSATGSQKQLQDVAASHHTHAWEIACPTDGMQKLCVTFKMYPTEEKLSTSPFPLDTCNEGKLRC